MRLAQALQVAWDKHAEMPCDLYERERQKMAAEMLRAVPLVTLIREWFLARLTFEK